MRLLTYSFYFNFGSSGDHIKLHSYVQNRVLTTEAKTKERSIKAANNFMLRKAMLSQGDDE